MLAHSMRTQYLVGCEKKAQPMLQWVRREVRDCKTAKPLALSVCELSLVWVAYSLSWGVLGCSQ